MGKLLSFSEKSTLSHLEWFLYNLDRELTEGQFDLDEIADFLPTALLLNEYEGTQSTNIFCSRNLAAMFDYDIDSWYNYDGEQLSGVRSMLEVIHPDDGKYVLPRRRDLLARNDPGELQCYFERIRLRRDGTYSWFWITGKIPRLLSKKKGNKRILINAIPVGDAESVDRRLRKVLREEIYCRKHFPFFQKLTLREKEVIRLLYQGKSNAQVGDILFISTETVKTHRKNIRSKLGISKIQELIHFAEAFDLCE